MTIEPTNVSEGLAACTCGELKPGYGHRDRCPTLTSLVDASGRPKIAPVQGYAAGIPWSIQLRAYDAYCKKWRSQAALIDLDRRGCRGGFGVEELNEFVPGWRDEVSEITALKKQIAELEAATLSPPLPSTGVERLSREQLEPLVYQAALKWCGEKERETFPEDIEYFKHNWSALPGLRGYVEREAALSALPLDGGDGSSKAQEK